MYSIVLFIVLMSMTKCCETYKILVVIPIPMKSHCILGNAISNLLLEAGNEVTYITYCHVEKSHPNFRQIVIKRGESSLKGTFTLKAIGADMIGRKDIFGKFLNVTYSTLSDPRVQALMEDSNEIFDLAIVEWMLNDLYSGLSAVFNCPYIWFLPVHHDHAMLRLIQEPVNPALSSNFRTWNVPPLSFVQRVEELIHAFWIASVKYFIFDPIESETYKKLYGPAIAKRGRILPSYDAVRYNASLILCNSHLTIRDTPVNPLAYKAIGGFHIAVTPEPLSQELLDVIDASKNGVILFSLGSVLKAGDMPVDMKRNLVAMFSKLNQTVLWNIDEQFEKLPDNVRTFNWIPQQSVLAHPKCVMFITHGGMLSLLESVHYGVPVIGVPVFADQGMNMKSAVRRGFARMVPLSLQLAVGLEEAIEDMLSNPRYKKTAMKMSAVYHDRTLPPGAELVHWAHHVAAMQGAPLLRSPELLLPWYQRFYVDLAAVLLILGICIVKVAKKIFACVAAKIIGSKGNVGTVETKKLI